MSTLCDSTNINTIIEFVPNCLQHVSSDGFNGGSDSYLQFRDKRAPCLLKLCIPPSNRNVRWWLFPEFGVELLLDNCTPTIILNNPVYSFTCHTDKSHTSYSHKCKMRIFSELIMGKIWGPPTNNVHRRTCSVQILFRKCDNCKGEVVFYRAFLLQVTGKAADHTFILHPPGHSVWAALLISVLTKTLCITVNTEYHLVTLLTWFVESCCITWPILRSLQDVLLSPAFIEFLHNKQTNYLTDLFNQHTN